MGFDHEIRDLIVGFGVVFLACFGIPVLQTAFFPGFGVIGAILALIGAILGIWLIIRAFRRYRWPDLVELHEQLVDLGVLNRKD